MKAGACERCGLAPNLCVSTRPMSCDSSPPLRTRRGFALVDAKELTEQAVLGGMFLTAYREDGARLDAALSRVEAEDFSPSHRAVLGAVRDLRAAGRWPILSAVTDTLGKRGALDLSGDVPGPNGELMRARGPVYLACLLHTVFSDTMLPHDVETLKQGTARATAARFGEALVDAAQHGRPLVELATTARKILEAVAA